MNLDLIRNLVNQLHAELHDSPTGEEPVEASAPFGRSLDGKPKFAPAYDACRQMWEAAQRAGVFSIFAYIGPGIQPGAGQMVEPHEPDLQAIEDAILALGRGPWGQDWLSHLENRAVTDPAYVRRFGFRPVTRKPDGSLAEY